ncbi:hypothetical protein V7S43_010362 [Phytophthora oleae]|uniref:Protein kinase domain-containing protein n=1 Tax=Phytophthora oleae TaxID=2107226 RepID=A0ABD3FCW9_9STRA
MNHIMTSFVLLFAVFCPFVTAQPMYLIEASYTGSSCEGTPSLIYSIEEPECGESLGCIGTDFESSQYNCSTDYLSTMRNMFGPSQYILQENFVGESCSTLTFALGFFASGNCEGSRNPNVEGSYSKTKLDINGLSSINYYNDSQCASDTVLPTEFASSSTLLNHSCDAYNFKWYSSAGGLDEPLSKDPSSSRPTPSGSDSGNGNTGSSTGAIVGIICGVVVVVAVCVAILIIYRRRSQDKSSGTLPTIPVGSDSIERALRGQTGLWNDDVITAKRIPRDKVKVKDLLSSGAYGEVYKGVYNRQEVAVKMLLPSTRGNIQHVTDFLAEAKLTATMDHPHIITFIGVAWDSLSDMCVVLEFMDGGDLRTLLNSYEAAKRPVGFDKQKATIALHVCEALTYLHSLMPPVIHRDLKSRNLLLNRNFEVKLTDFGISKKRLDQTMTAGVGTSLWMAPEVMLGEKYDVKADIFSFGVVLSELDAHTLPYTQAKERSLASTGRKMADATLLQKITSGEIRVEFSELNPQPLLELGLACVSVDPADRPTAAEATYRLQMAIRQELV